MWRHSFSKMILPGERTTLQLLWKVLGTVQNNASQFTYLQKPLLHRNSACCKKISRFLAYVQQHSDHAHFEICFLQVLKFPTYWAVPILFPFSKLKLWSTFYLWPPVILDLLNVSWLHLMSYHNSSYRPFVYASKIYTSESEFQAISSLDHQQKVTFFML